MPDRVTGKPEVASRVRRILVGMAAALLAPTLITYGVLLLDTRAWNSAVLGGVASVGWVVGLGAFWLLARDVLHAFESVVLVPLASSEPFDSVDSLSRMEADHRAELVRLDGKLTHMNRELHHRIRNLLATVLGIANVTSRSAPDIETFRLSFADRIVALSQTHTLLMDNIWDRVGLIDLARTGLDLNREDYAKRLTAEGEDTALPSDMALALGMAFFELKSNAARFGALSSEHGKVALKWHCEGEADNRTLVLDWRESGGPTVQVPGRRGFGSQMLQQILVRQLKGSVAVHYLPDGLHVEIRTAL